MMAAPLPPGPSASTVSCRPSCQRTCRCPAASVAAPRLPAIWAAETPIAWQLDGTDDATGTGALRLPNGVDVDVNIGDWAALTALVPADHRDTDPAPFDPTPPVLRLHPDEVPALEDLLATMADDTDTPTETPTSKSQQMLAVKET